MTCLTTNLFVHDYLSNTISQSFNECFPTSSNLPNSRITCQSVELHVPKYWLNISQCLPIRFVPILRFVPIIYASKSRSLTKIVTNLSRCCDMWKFKVLSASTCIYGIVYSLLRCYHTCHDLPHNILILSLYTFVNWYPIADFVRFPHSLSWANTETYDIFILLCIVFHETSDSAWEKRIYINTYIHTYIYTDRQTDRQTDNQTIRQTYKFIYKDIKVPG